MPAEPDPDLVPALAALFAAKRLREVREIIRAHPVLLDPRTDAHIRQETAQVTTPAYLDHIDRILWTLERCRRMGIDAHFAELEPMADLLRHLDETTNAPKDLNKASAEELQPDADTGDTLASLSVSAYRGQDYPYAGGQAEQIKAAGEDHYLVLLANRSTTETDWAEAARKIENIQRAQARKYVADLAKRHGENPIISRIGVEFIKCATPNAFALHIKEDDSVAIGVDPGLQSLFALLFHASRLAIYYGNVDFLIDLLSDLVKLHFFGQRIKGLEERILSLDKFTGPMDRHWADWAGYVATCFLLGHEVGHIHLGHFQRDQVPQLRMVPDRESVGEITAFGHECEFEADEWSANELIQTSDTLSSRIGACTMPAIFMSLMAMVEDLYLPVDPVGRVQRENHPPARERAQRLSKIGMAVFHDPSILVGDIRRLFEMPNSIESIRSGREFQNAAAITRSLTRQEKLKTLPPAPAKKRR